jgi:hypothetical protein
LAWERKGREEKEEEGLDTEDGWRRWLCVYVSGDDIDGSFKGGRNRARHELSDQKRDASDTVGSNA